MGALLLRLTQPIAPRASMRHTVTAHDFMVCSARAELQSTLAESRGRGSGVAKRRFAAAAAWIGEKPGAAVREFDGHRWGTSVPEMQRIGKPEPEH